MLQWNAMHPYNALHVARIAGTLDLARLRDAIHVTLESWGLTGLALNRDQGRYQYHGGPAGCEIKTVAGPDSPRSALHLEIERQLNTAFVLSERFDPFRFFVAPDSDSFSVGLVYFHAVADAESITRLLKGIVDTYRKGRSSEVSEPMNLYCNRHNSLLGRPVLVTRKLLAIPAQMRAMRSSCRPRCRDAQDLANGFDHFSLSRDGLLSLRAAGKSWGVTLNDLFLALLLKSLSSLAIGRTKSRKRRAISEGCIVNLRSALGVDSRQTFGLFLGSFTITHEVPEGIGLKDLARDVQQQTAAIKGHKLFLGTPIELAFARLMLKFLSPEQRLKFYPKNYPLWGGITNMNLDSIWPQASGDLPVDCLRAVSTGPVTPLVLSITTSNGGANLGLSYRTAFFSQAQVEEIRNCFLGAIGQLRITV